ncbi:MAG: energy-coupling factor transporter transmembrane component T family protein [Faecousia sp.]
MKSPSGDFFFLGDAMTADAFSNCHPAVNFLFFMGAIGFCVLIQHPAYLIAGAIGAAVYYLLLSGKKGWKRIGMLVPMFVLLAAVNPLFNIYGDQVLFYFFGRPYTVEALLYGAAIAGVFLVMMIWFGCYSTVMTSDKFTSLFGNLIPAVSLLLVMVLRMIPSFIRKAQQIMGARKSIGMGAGEQSSFRDKITYGMRVLSALTDWALEGSVVTGDSMRARGYGSAKRTSFQIYHMKLRDWGLLAVMAVLAGAAAVVSAMGGTAAEFTPELSIQPLTGIYALGFMAYCAYLLIPSALHIKEVIQWRISRSGI